MGQTTQETSALREINYGVAGGKPQEWLDSRYTPALAKRVFPFVDEVVGRPCQTQIIVTHGFTLSMVVAAWMRIPIDAAGFVSFPVKSGSITQFRQDDFLRNRAVISIGDVTHFSEV